MKDDQYSVLRKTFQNPVTFLGKDHPFPVSPTPFIISAKKYQSICTKAKCVLIALEKAAQTVLDNDPLWTRFSELHSFEDLVRLPSTTPHMVDLARFDLAISKEGDIGLMETNAACPGALTTVGDVNAAFVGTEEYLKHISDRVVPQRIDFKFYFVDYLASLIPQGLPKHLAFISSRHRSYPTDLARLTELANERGYIGIHCDAQDLTYDGTRVSFDNVPIHAAFLKFSDIVIPGNLIDLGMCGPDNGPNMPFLQALRDGALPCVNSFVSRLLVENKRLLAMLTEDEVQAVLTDEQKMAVKDLVIPTFSLDSKGLGDFGGAPRLLREKDQWVVKKVMETRGRGVYIGRYHTEEEWHRVVTTLDLESCVAQRFVQLDVQEVHKSLSGTPGLFKAYTDIGLYLLGGEPIGFLCRGSADPVVNVGKCGALRPTYVIRDS